MFNWLKKLVNFGVEETPASGVRARKKGRFVADDKSTPNVNEAYVGGKRNPAAKKAPAKRGRPRKTTKK